MRFGGHALPLLAFVLIVGSVKNRPMPPAPFSSEPFASPGRFPEHEAA